MVRSRTLTIWLAALAGAVLAQASDNNSGVPTRVVVTVEGQKGAQPPEVTRNDVMASLDNQRMTVTDWTPILSQGAGLQLWLLIDDGTDTNLGTQFNDLHKFVESQSPLTQIGVGYIRNGSVQAVQPLTTDHAAAAKAIRLPVGQPGISASPYVTLSELIKKWPRGEQAREVVMITSGIDPDFGPGAVNPYLDKAIEDAQRAGVVVHAIYYASAGHLGHSQWQIYWGQNYLSKLTEETGGEFFWIGDANPVSLAPYFNELNEHFRNQHLLTFIATGKTGLRRLKLTTEVPHASLEGPMNVYVAK